MLLCGILGNTERVLINAQIAAPLFTTTRA
jgi:hypothetical protein